MILFSIFCGLLVGLCLLGTIVEKLSALDKLRNKVDTVENTGHISMDKDADEKTPLLQPDITTKNVKQNEGKKSKIFMTREGGKLNVLYIYIYNVIFQQKIVATYDAA